MEEAGHKCTLVPLTGAEDKVALSLEPIVDPLSLVVGANCGAEIEVSLSLPIKA